MSKPSATPAPSTPASAMTMPIITRIDDRFVRVDKNGVSEVVFSPIRPGIKLFDTPPTASPRQLPGTATATATATGTGSGTTTGIAHTPSSPVTASPQGQAGVAAGSTRQMAGDSASTADQPVRSIPFHLDPRLGQLHVDANSSLSDPPLSFDGWTLSADPFHPAAPLTDQPVTVKPNAARPAGSAAALAPDLSPQQDRIDGKNVLVYGAPKSYDKLNYAQGNAVPGFRGTSAEASAANLLDIAGQNVTEGDLIKVALANRWCNTATLVDDIRGGMTMNDQRKLLGNYGVATGVITDFDANKLAALVKQGKGVIIGVNDLQLWGKNPSQAVLENININHLVNLTGVVYAADTGALQGFYIADSGRQTPSDVARYVSVSDLDKAAHFDFGCNAIYTLDPIKQAAQVAGPAAAGNSPQQHNRTVVDIASGPTQQPAIATPVVATPATATPAVATPAVTSQPVKVDPGAADQPVVLGGWKLTADPFNLAPLLGSQPHGVLPAIATISGLTSPTEADYPAQKDTIDGKNVLVYGFPKSFDMLDYAQGDYMPGFRGTCGEASVANLLDIAGLTVDEYDVLTDAIDHGWCDTTTPDPDLRGGITTDNQRKLLDSYGVETGVLNDFDPNKLATLIKQGKGVIIGVNAEELWGAKQSTQALDRVNINHVVNLTGAVYSADTGALQGFYITDSGRQRPSDVARYISVSELDKVAHFDFGCNVIYTLNPIKTPGNINDAAVADPTLAQLDHVVGQDVLVFGSPKAYKDLIFNQYDAMHGYGATSGEACVANISLLAGRPVSEKDVLQKAIQEQLCDTTSKSSELRGGTTAKQQLTLLNELGFSSTLANGFDAAAIAQSIKQGKGVIVSVNSSTLWNKNERTNVGNTDHSINITGVAYSLSGGNIAGFYLADSGRGISYDICRFVTLQEMLDATHAGSVTTITTNDAIKLHKHGNQPTGAAPVIAPTPAAPVGVVPVIAPKPAVPVGVAPAIAPKPVAPAGVVPVAGPQVPAASHPSMMSPQQEKIGGSNVLVYGNPESYHQLDYAQGSAVPGYRGTCGEASVANITAIGGRAVSEKDVVQRAIKDHLCDTVAGADGLRGGTSAEDQQTLLKDFGFATTIDDGFDAQAVAQHIKQGKGVLVSVNADRLWGDQLSDHDNSADHVVTVTGVACEAKTGKVSGFFIADSGRGMQSDMCRFVSEQKLLDATNVEDANTITTTEAIKLTPQGLSASGNTPAASIAGKQAMPLPTASSGKLWDNGVAKLVQAMASFAPPAATQSAWSGGQRDKPAALLSVIH